MYLIMYMYSKILFRYAVSNVIGNVKVRHELIYYS